MDCWTIGRKTERSLQLLRYAQYMDIRDQGLSNRKIVAKVKSRIDAIMRQRGRSYDRSW